jgi:signal transduction histidine kinase
MNYVPKLRSIFFFLGFFARGTACAQHTDSLLSHLAGLRAGYLQNTIRDTDYLKAVDSIAPLLEKEDSLPGLLATYRQIAFNDARWGKYRAGYYTYLAIHAYNFSRLGSAVYYSEKNNEERTKTGQFEKGGLSHSDLFALTVYANNRDYPRVFARYAALRPVLVALPAAVPAGTISGEQVFVAVSILQTVNYAACRGGDTGRAKEAVRLMEDMLNGVNRSPAAYKGYRLLYSYLSHSMYYEYHRFLQHADLARDYLLAAIRDVLDKGFAPHLQTAYTENLYSEAVDLYFNRHNTDSARYYLSLLTTGDGKVRYSSLDPAFLMENNSRLLAGQGRFAEAYAALQRVYKWRDSAYYAVSSDKDNNLYALAQAENTQMALLRSEEKKRSAEKSTIVLLFLLTVLLLGGFAGFVLYRSDQKRRLLDLRLQLARNFHDEIGPMLLYASILAKKQGDEEQKKQLSLIMDAVRSIAHDLKSTRLCTVASLIREINGLLEKVKGAAGIDFSLQSTNGSRILSHGQFTQLQAIVQELVSNSIKYADCSLITLKIAAPERMFTLRYSDNGKGIGPGSSPGIGLQNIQERATALKGSFNLHNSWPEGYYIDISIPLV